MNIFSTEQASTDSAGVADNVNLASTVRAINTAAAGTNHLVSVVDSSGGAIGSITLAGGQSEVINKNGRDKLFAANAAVLFAKVSR